MFYIYIYIGETYEENAEREIEEESGVKVHLEPLLVFYYPGIKVWGKSFLAYFDGEVEDLKPQVEEVELIKAASIQEIYDMITRGEQFTPDGSMAMEGFKSFIQ